MQRRSKPIINYLAQEQANDEEEEKKDVPRVIKEHTGFIGLDDDDDDAIGFDRAFGNFKRKG